MIKKVRFLGCLCLISFCYSFGNQDSEADRSFQLGQRFESTSQFDLALDAYKLAIEQSPEHVPAHRRYQILMIHRFGEENEIYWEYEAKTKSDPDNIVFRYLFHRLTTNPYHKRKLARAIIDDAPDFYWGYYLLGVASIEIQDYNGAVEALEKAIYLDPTVNAGYLSKASAHLFDGNAEKMKKSLAKASWLDVNGWRCIRATWRAHWDRHPTAEIKQKVNQIVDSLAQTHDRDANFLAAAMKISAAMNDDKQINRFRKQLLKCDPQGPVAMETAFYQIGYGQDWDNVVKRSLAILEKFPQINFHRSTVYYSLFLDFTSPAFNDTSFVIDLCRNFLLEFPDKEEGLVKMLKFLRFRAPDRTVSVLQEVLPKLPPPKRGYDFSALGWEYYQQGRFEEALSTLLRADSILSENRLPSWYSFYRIGKTRLALRDTLKAMKDLAHSFTVSTIRDAKKTYETIYEQYYGSIDGLDAHIKKQIIEAQTLSNPFPLPDQILTDLDGDNFHLSQHKGKATVIHFWEPG